LLLLHKRGIKGASVMLACEDYPSLLDRQISKIRSEFPSSLGTLKEGVTRDFILHEQYGSGQILLRNLDDPAKYLSAEFAGIAVDELTRNRKEVFDFLRLRLRWPGVPDPRFVAGSNPSGEGHSWVKQLWVEEGKPNFPKELEKLRDEFYFVPAKSSDNPFLSQSYHDDLETLPPDMAKAYADGSWDIFAGQYFDFWDMKLTVHSADIKLEPWWPRWISGDWGFKHPSAIYWHARNDDTIFTYREFHRAGMDEDQLAREIVSLSNLDVNAQKERLKFNAFFLSPDAFAKRTSQNTVAQVIGNEMHVHGMPYPVLADNDRVGGARLMYQMLKNGYWKICRDTCPKLVQCLPTLIRDPNKLEDVLKVDATDGVLGDDAYDGARYGLKSYLRSREKPEEVKHQEKLQSMQDPHARFLYEYKYRALRESRSNGINQRVVPRWAR